MSLLSPLTELLPDLCTPELRRLQAELGARHSYREAARLLGMLLPCGPMNHVTIRNRTHRVAGDLEAAVSPTSEPDPDLSTEIMMVIDGAHIRAAHGYQSSTSLPSIRNLLSYRFIAGLFDLQLIPPKAPSGPLLPWSGRSLFFLRSVSAPVLVGD